jgi:DNA polymerase V
MRTPKAISEIFQPQNQSKIDLPIYESAVSAGFPSPADDYLEGVLDLNQHLIKHPAATFFLRVVGDSMIRVGIHPGDLLIVDRSLEAKDGRVVIAVVNGELLVKRMRIKSKQIYLVAENPKYSNLLITEAMDFQVWGVVTNVVHAL